MCDPYSTRKQKVQQLIRHLLQLQDGNIIYMYICIMAILGHSDWSYNYTIIWPKASFPIKIHLTLKQEQRYTAYLVVTFRLRKTDLFKTKILKSSSFKRFWPCQGRQSRADGKITFITFLTKIKSLWCKRHSVTSSMVSFFYSNCTKILKKSYFDVYKLYCSICECGGP